MQLILNFCVGVDEQRKITNGSSAGYGFVLRHFSSLGELRQWRDAFMEFLAGPDFLIHEATDFNPERNKMSPKSSKTSTASGKKRGRPPGSKNKAKPGSEPPAWCRGDYQDRSSGGNDRDDGFGGNGGGGYGVVV